MRTTATYSRVRCSCLAKRCPCQPSATWGPEEPIPRIMRPSESWSIVAAVIAVIAGERPGHLEDAGAEADLRGLPREPAEHGRGVRAIGLCGPYGVIAQPLGLLDDLELVLGGEAQAPVADVHAELHVQVSFQREGIRCRAGTRAYAWPRTTGHGWTANTRGAQPMRNRRRPSSSPVERLRLAIDCLPVGTREAMLTGRARDERIIAGAYVDRDGGVCPMLAAHRAGGRTDLLAFARSWDRFTRTSGAARTATARELRILIAQLEASLMNASAVDLDVAIKEHRELRGTRIRSRRRLADTADPSGEIVARRLRSRSVRRLLRAGA